MSNKSINAKTMNDNAESNKAMSHDANIKFVEAIRFIYDHLDEPLDLERVASAVGASVSSLKRIFEQVSQISPGALIRKLRLEQAFKSMKSKQDTVLETALAVGFQDHAAFSRAFKNCFGYSPTIARSKINIVQELECVSLVDPEIVDMVPIEIQSVTKQGLYFECAPQAWASLKVQLNEMELGDDFSGLFIGIGHDNPHEGEVEANQVRFTAGVSSANRDLGLNRIILAGGRYARFKYEGRPVNLGMAYHYIFGKWVNTSGFKIRKEFPAFMVFDSFPESDCDCRVMIHVPICEG